MDVTEKKQNAIAEALTLHTIGAAAYQDAIDKSLTVLKDGGFTEQESLNVLNSIINDYNQHQAGGGCDCEGECGSGCGDAAADENCDCGCGCQ